MAVNLSRFRNNNIEKKHYFKKENQESVALKRKWPALNVYGYYCMTNFFKTPCAGSANFFKCSYPESSGLMQGEIAKHPVIGY